MAEKTHQRGRADTAESSLDEGQAPLWAWRGRSRATGRETRERNRFWSMVGASVLGHLVLTPAPALLGLLSLLAPVEKSDEPAVDAIPIDLLEEGPALAPPPAPPAVPPESAPAAPVAPPEPNAPASGEKTPKPPAPKEPLPPAEKPATGSEGGALADPVKMAGLAGQAADSNANVRVLLHTNVIRDHALGPRVGGLLRRTPQWSDFFGPAGVDPIRDIDHVLIAGPQLRDSSNVVAVVQHRLPEEQVKIAFDRLVARGGEWIGESPRMAKAKADRAERLFVAPSPRIVAVVPPSAEKSARKLGKNLRFPAGDAGVAVSVYLVTPWRVARAVGLVIPKSIEWAKAEVRPDARGGLTLAIEAADENEEFAKANAEGLERNLRAATEIDFSRLAGGLGGLVFGSKKQKFVEKIDFESRGKTIRGTLVLTASQVETLLDLLDGMLPPEKKAPREPDPVPVEPEAPPAQEKSGTEAGGEPASAVTPQKESTEAPGAPATEDDSTPPPAEAPPEPH